MRWRVLKALGLPPNDRRVREMSEGDIVYCYVNSLMDEEETSAGYGEAAVNSAFDPTQYYETGGAADDDKTGSG